jgi:hypothetical protein
MNQHIMLQSYFICVYLCMYHVRLFKHFSRPGHACPYALLLNKLQKEILLDKNFHTMLNTHICQLNVAHNLTTHPR